MRNELSRKWVVSLDEFRLTEESSELRYLFVKGTLLRTMAEGGCGAEGGRAMRHQWSNQSRAL